MKTKKVGINSLETISKIGKGSFAEVSLVREKASNQIFALKSIEKSSIGKKTSEKHIKSERKILKELRESPFIVESVGCFQTQAQVHFVLQYCPGGDLYELLHKRTKFTEDQAKFYVAQLVLAVEHMHSKNVVYRDLKPENILIDQDGYLRVTDFGLSFIKNDVKSSGEICGTPEYLSPEMISGNEYDHMIDWWALGCLLYELLVGVPPFVSDNREELFSLIKFTQPKFPKYLSKKVVNLITQLLCKNPCHRLGVRGASKIKKHAWFKVVNWNFLEEKKYDSPFKPIPDGRYGLSNFNEEFTQSPSGESEVVPETLDILDVLNDPWF
jgi:serum/glucocorticoid-regulated kinase 2